MKTDIYNNGYLNAERIATYLKLAEEYNLDETTVGRIFSKGAEWGFEVAERSTHINTSECFPSECDHPVDKRTYYDGGSSWCNKCWSYVDMPNKITDCKHFDESQGRNKCLHPKIGYRFFSPRRCIHICKHFEKK